MNRFDEKIAIEKFIEYLQATQEWRTLKDKTQVFNERAENVKSRGVHCDDVGDISYALCELLGADEETSLKSRLIGLVHDLGHIPFGHAGESIADSILKDYEFTEEELVQISEVRKKLFGTDYASKNNEVCFEHNENSVLQFITMCKRFGYEVDPEIVTGILAHSTSRYKELPESLSQQAVRLADKLAYINYDVNDLFLSFQGKEEMEALEVLYRQPLLDPNGNEIKIDLPDGKSYTIYEFLTQLSAAQRIDLLINASVKDAQDRVKDKPEKYKDYETILTGCNDVVVELSGLRKKHRKATDQETKDMYYARIQELKSELYRRSPLLFAAYEIKDRSDDFIRSGIGLSRESQIDRSQNSLSAVGNKDLMNEYIYKSLVTHLKQIVDSFEGLTPEQIGEKYRSESTPKEFIELYSEYMSFKKEQDSVILGLDENNNSNYPEIYTIINFIGVHSNTELAHLAQLSGIVDKFYNEVLPKTQSLIENPDFYDSKKGVFTKLGMKERERIVSEYGSIINLEFGLEEESISPLASEGSVERAIEAGYSVSGVSKSVVTSKEFETAASLSESEYMALQTRELANQTQMESGRTI